MKKTTILIALTIAFAMNLIAAEFYQYSGVLPEGTNIYKSYELETVVLTTVEDVDVVIRKGISAPYLVDGILVTPISVENSTHNIDGWIDASLYEYSDSLDSLGIINQTLIPTYYLESMNRNDIDVILNEDYPIGDFFETRQNQLTFLDYSFGPWLIIFHPAFIGIRGPDVGQIFFVENLSAHENMVEIDFIGDGDEIFRGSLSVIILQDRIEVRVTDSSLPLDHMPAGKYLNEDYKIADLEIINAVRQYVEKY